MQQQPDVATSGDDAAAAELNSSSAATTTHSPVSKTSERQRLPRLVPSNKHRSILLNSPPHNATAGHGGRGLENLDERRRFINVVRPLSFFPEPALPPNYVLPVKNEHLSISQVNSSSTRTGRPPSPAPFNRQPPARRQNFSVAGQGVGANGYSNGGSGSLKINLAGGSGWDLTAIRRGYNNGVGKTT